MQVDKEHSRLEDTIKRSSATGKVQNQPSIVVTPVYSSRASRHGESAPHLTPLLRDMSDGLHSRPPVVLSARSVCVCCGVGSPLFLPVSTHCCVRVSSPISTNQHLSSNSYLIPCNPPTRLSTRATQSSSSSSSALRCFSSLRLYPRLRENGYVIWTFTLFGHLYLFFCMDREARNLTQDPRQHPTPNADISRAIKTLRAEKRQTRQLHPQTPRHSPAASPPPPAFARTGSHPSQ